MNSERIERYTRAIYNGWFNDHRRKPQGRWDKQHQRDLARQRAIEVEQIIGASLDRDDVVELKLGPGHQSSA